MRDAVVWKCETALLIIAIMGIIISFGYCLVTGAPATAQDHTQGNQTIAAEGS